MNKFLAVITLLCIAACGSADTEIHSRRFTVAGRCATALHARNAGDALEHVIATDSAGSAVAAAAAAWQQVDNVGLVLANRFE